MSTSKLKQNLQHTVDFDSIPIPNDEHFKVCEK